MIPSTKSAAVCGVLTGLGTVVADLVSGPIQRAVPALGQSGTFLLLVGAFFVAPVFVLVFGVPKASMANPFSQEALTAHGAALKRGLAWFLVHAVVWIPTSALYETIRA